MKLTINNKESLLYAFGQIKEMLSQHKFLRITLTAGRDRSREQNALAWAWYNQIAIERGEDNVEDVHTFCKAYFGIPILREDESFDAEYRENLLSKEPGKRVPYEARMFIIRHLPVTSRMTVKQMSRYLEEMQRHYASLESDPVILTFPDDWD